MTLELAGLLTACEVYLARHGSDSTHANIVNAVREVLRRMITDQPPEEVA